MSLIHAIIDDIKTPRFKWRILPLFILLLCSVLAVNYYAFANRRLIAESEALEKSHDNLALEWRNLRLEQQALTEYSRLDQIARKSLNMQPIDLSQEVLVKRQTNHKKKD